MRAHGIRLAGVLSAVSILFLWPIPAYPDALPKADAPPFSVTGGYSGYVVPLPDYAARIVARGDEQYSTANLVYNDISLAPLHIRLSDDYADSAVEVIVHNRSCPISLPSSAAFLAEPSAKLAGYSFGTENGETAPHVTCRFTTAIPSGTAPHIYMPIQLYQFPRDAGSTVIQVEILSDGEPIGKEAVALEFLPRGKVYSCLIEAEGRGLLEGDSLAPADENLANAWLKYPGFLQEHALVSVAPENIGPDFRVLRHFGFVIASIETWRGSDDRARAILTDAAAMGSRLVVYGAAEQVAVGNKDRQPQRGLQLNSFGFGGVAVSSDDLALLREHIAALLRTDMYYAYSLMPGKSSKNIGGALTRDLIVRRTLGNLSTGWYSWIGQLSALPQAKGAINPIWAYGYITRAELLHPLDVARLHWDSREQEGAGTELVERAGADYPPLHSYLSANIRRTTCPYGFETLLYTLLLLILSTFLFIYQRSYLWLALAILILSLLATVLFSLGVRIGVSGQPSSLVVSALLVSPESSVADVRSVAYITSAHALRLDLGIPSAGFAPDRIVPLDTSDISIAVREGTSAAIDGLKVAPLLPLEVSYSEARAVTAPVSFEWEVFAEGSRKLSLAANEPLSFAFLVDGSRAMYLGEIQPGQPRSIILPSGDSPVDPLQVRYDATIARMARHTYSTRRRYEARGARMRGPTELTYTFLQEVLLYEALRTLVVDGRGTTLLGIRLDECELVFNDEAHRGPRAELLIYRLE